MKHACLIAVMLCVLCLSACGGDDPLRAPSANEISRAESDGASEDNMSNNDASDGDTSYSDTSYGAEQSAENSGIGEGITLPDDIF